MARQPIEREPKGGAPKKTLLRTEMALPMG